MTPRSPAMSDEGFSLVAVLGFLVIVSSILLPLTIVSHTRLLSAKYDLDQIRLNMIIDSAVSAITYRWMLDQTYPDAGLNEFRCIYPDFTLQVQVLTLEGLIDLNAASEKLLKIGFLAVNVPQRQAAEIAKAVIAFRSRRAQLVSGIGTIPNGGLKHGLIESVVELHDFEQLRQISLGQLERIFTVHKRSATLTFGQAVEELKIAINSVRSSEIDLPFLKNTSGSRRSIYLHVRARLSEKTWFGYSTTIRIGRDQKPEQLDHSRQIISAGLEKRRSVPIDQSACADLFLDRIAYTNFKYEGGVHG